MKRPKASASPATTLDRYRVPILDRTMDLLELLTRHGGGMTLTAMTEALEMPKNSVFRIATTLTLRGYLERDEASRAYRASGKLLSLGNAVLGGERLLQLAWPVLTALRDESKETALIGTLAGSLGVVLDQVPSSHPVKVVVELGHSFPLHTAAPAKAILAFLDPGQCEKLVGAMPFPKMTRHTLTSARAYRKELDQVKALGYALDRGEESETYVCAAAPVFNHRGSPIAAIWISGPSDRLLPDSLKSAGALVQRHAGRLSQKLGFPGS